MSNTEQLLSQIAKISNEIMDLYDAGFKPEHQAVIELQAKRDQLSKKLRRL